MARLYRPPIPLEVKCRVVLAQLGEMFPDDVIEAYRRRLRVLLTTKLAALATLFECEMSELRLDHDPALALRVQRAFGKKVRYVPDANDPEYLFYRPHGAQFTGSHDVKTRIRGDHGQFSDVALIKRERRRQRRELKPAKKASKLAPTSVSRPKARLPKPKWPKRTFPKRSKRWRS